MKPVARAQGGAAGAPRRSGAPAFAWDGPALAAEVLHAASARVGADSRFSETADPGTDSAREDLARPGLWSLPTYSGLARRLAAGFAREARLLRRAPAETLRVWAVMAIAQTRGWLGADIDQRRHWLWLPVLFGCGVIWYFNRLTPGDAGPSLGAACALLLAAMTRRQPAARMALIALAMIPAGYAASALRLAVLDAPVLQRPAIGELTGYIVAVDQRGAGSRLLVAPVSFANLSPQQLPRLVRLSVRQAEPLRAGVMVRTKARLLPPPEAARPGGYDFARDAWFRQIGGSGSALGRVAVLNETQAAWVDAAPAQPGASSQGRDKHDQDSMRETSAPPTASPWAWRLAAWIDNGRMRLTERIAGAWGGQAGAVAAALVTGKRGQIADETNVWLRAAGIYHIISISGLHMVLAAGMFFWTARAALALSPWCALHLPVRKIAAILAMAGATAYCIFSGADVATERSLIMILAMLGAILVDRPALSMHNLAVAAMVVLVREPESLLGPGFQMSFAAVAGLIVLADRGVVTPGQPRRRRPQPGLIRRMAAPLVTVGLTTLVCELATGPFSVWHFQSVYPLGLIGNAMALPFLSLVVMPAAVVGVALTPLGLDWPVWWVMGAATEPVLYVAMRIAATPHAVAGVAAPGPGALLCLSAAIVWFVIWRTPLRWAALAPALAGLVLLQAAPTPDVLADRQGRGALVVQGAGRDAEGRLRVTLLGAPSSFTVEQWLRAVGDQRTAADPSLRSGARCDPLGCIVTRDDGGAVAWSRERRSLFEDCARADVVVSPHRAPSGCGAAVMLDRQTLAQLGAASIYLQEGAATVRRVRKTGENWPWTPAKSSRYEPPARRTFQPTKEAERQEGADLSGVADLPGVATSGPASGRAPAFRQAEPDEEAPDEADAAQPDQGSPPHGKRSEAAVP